VEIPANYTRTGSYAPRRIEMSGLFRELEGHIAQE
jgi:hypothetical protein